VQDGAELGLDERALLLDDDDLVDRGGEVEGRVLDQGVSQREPEDPHARLSGVGDPEAGQGFEDVEVALARADDAERGSGPGAGDPVQAVVPGVLLGGGQAPLGDEGLLVGHGVRADRGQRPVRPRAAVDDHVTGVARVVAGRVEVDGPDAVGDRGDDLQPDPGAAVAGEPESVHPEVEHVLLVAGEQHRDAGVGEGVLAVARQRGGLRARVVAAEHDRAAVRPGAHRVGVLQRVA